MEVHVAFDAEDRLHYTAEYEAYVHGQRRLHSVTIRGRDSDFSFRFLAASLGAGSLAGYIAGNMTQSFAWTIGIGLAATVAMGSAYWTIVGRSSERNAIRALRRMVYLLHITQEGMAIRTTTCETTYFWTNIRDIVVSDHYVFFLLNDAEVSVITAPLHCFASPKAGTNFVSAAVERWKHANSPTMVTD